MSLVTFDIMELELLAIYECDTKQETLAYIQEAIGFVDKRDAELIAYMESAANKLSMISDAEFKALELSTYLHDWEEDLDED